MCTGFRRLIRNSILLVLTITCVPDTDAGQQVLQSGEPARLAVVGKVIDATTSQPIVGATVTFTALPARQAIRPMSAVSARGSTRTDETGAFSVAANNTIGLRIAAAADGYIPGAYGQMWPKGPDVVLGRNAIATQDVVIKLWKYASLSGTVVRSDGTPIEGVTVSLYTHSPMQLARSAVTDRAGRYQMEGLASGSYVVGVLPTYNTFPRSLTEQPDSRIPLDLASELARSGAPHPVADGIRQGEFVVQTPKGFPPSEREGTLTTYRSVFYDRAEVPSAALPIRLRPGEARQGVNLELESANTIRVSGRVSGPEGYVPNVAVHLVHSDSDTNIADETIFVASTVTDANGFFTMLGVAPGRYELRVWQRPGPSDRTNLAARPRIPGRPANDSRPLLWASMPVLVETTDVRNIAISLTNGPVLEGTVEQERPGDDTVRSQFPTTLVLHSVDRRTAPTRITVFPDRTFSAGVLSPGRYYLSTLSADEWSLASARTSGGDLAKEAVTLTAGDYHVDVHALRRNSALVIELAPSAASTRGDGATVLVFPAKERPIASDDLFRVVVVPPGAVDAREALPPGEYLAVALSAAAFDLDWRESEIIDRLIPHATTVVVRNAGTARVTLRPIDFR